MVVRKLLSFSLFFFTLWFWKRFAKTFSVQNTEYLCHSGIFFLVPEIFHISFKTLHLFPFYKEKSCFCVVFCFQQQSRVPSALNKFILLREDITHNLFKLVFKSTLNATFLCFQEIRQNCASFWFEKIKFLSSHVKMSQKLFFSSW